jgi:Chromo (CHRromatin Organisation MOdifier) domain
MAFDDWQKVLPLVQSALNNSPSSRLQNKTPMHVFTEHSETTPLALALKGGEEIEVATVEFIKVQKLVEVGKTSEVMAEIHRQVAIKSTKSRLQAIDQLNEHTHVHTPNFAVGDFVLVADPVKQGKSKLQVKWKGPRRIVGVESEFVYLVENMTTKDVKAAHATRMRFYKDKSLNMTEELKQAAEHNDHQLYVVAKILEIRYKEEEMKYEVLVAWRSFPVGDATWEPYDVMEIDVPEMVCKFLDSHKDKRLVHKVRSLVAHHGEVL